jgi:hypothetical protein
VRCREDWSGARRREVSCRGRGAGRLPVPGRGRGDERLLVGAGQGRPPLGRTVAVGGSLGPGRRLGFGIGSVEWWASGTVSGGSFT